jgi:prepilin signal peptidase PulO-like enzyme (type II secretory pathway)
MTARAGDDASTVERRRSDRPLAVRLYLLVGDLLATPGVSAGVALAVAWLVPETWNGVTGMLVGMLVGTLVATVCLALLTPLFGAFEIMLPGMTSGMIAGMVVGMLAAMGPIEPGYATGLGGLVGVAVLGSVRLLDRRIRRQEPSWTF